MPQEYSPPHHPTRKDPAMLSLKRIAFLLATAVATQATAAELKVLLPQGRVAYQTNEPIAVSVVRSDTQPLAAGKLTLTVDRQGRQPTGLHVPLGRGGRWTARRPAASEHLTVNARLLRPGRVHASRRPRRARTAKTRDRSLQPRPQEHVPRRPLGLRGGQGTAGPAGRRRHGLQPPDEHPAARAISWSAAAWISWATA